MADTFSRIYVQIVFVVKGRRNLISEDWEDDLFKYITGIVKNKGQLLIAINGMLNHIHILIGMKPTLCLSDLVREIKKSSNEFINNNLLIDGKFYWQDGFGAFSYSHTDLKNVIRYIENQKQHHQKQTFKSEFINLLEEFNIPFNNDYLFEF